MERKKIYIMEKIFSKNDMESMEKNIKAFFSAHNIKLELPVDIFDIATQLDFDVRGADFPDKLEGLILVDENQDVIENFDSNKIIAYNCNKNLNSKKFIVAHELAHYIVEKSRNSNAKIMFATRDHEDEYSENEFEQKIDYYAAALLIPKEDIISNFKSDTIDINDKSIIDKVASKYNVDAELAKRRLREVFACG